jgi:uncharacterized membrane protein YeaQ/YmgE (transglycosylase-associated protein family)
MIWPFRRGTLGVLVNLVAGIGGALAAAIASYAVLPASRGGEGPVRLFFAVLGALTALGLVHAAWSRYRDVAQRRPAG